MTVCVAPDISYFQKKLTLDYPRDFVIFRVTHGATFLDPNFHANAQIAAELHAKGKLAGAALYSVFTKDSVADQFNFAWKAIGARPSWLKGFIEDVETWRGTSYALSGDHSASINNLCGRHAAKFGTFRSVLGYGNWGDLGLLYPHRDPRIRFIEAKYASTIPSRTGKIGQQYTDGETRWSVPKIGGVTLPRATAGIGNCDHNVFPAYANGRALAAALSPAPVAPKPPVVPPKPAAPYYDPTKWPHALVDPAGAYAALLDSTGRIQIHHNGKPVRTI